MYAYTFPPMTETVLENGLRLICVPMREHNGLVIEVQIPVGRFSEPRGLEGITELTVGLMQKGTVELDAEQLSEKLEQTGAALYSDVGEEQTVIGCRMLGDYASKVIWLFWNIICTPGLREKELGRIKKEMIMNLQAEWSDPGALALKHFYTQLCGEDHPAGRRHTISTIKRISIDDIRKFYTQRFTPTNSTVVIVGNFDFEKNWQSLEQLFLSWPASQLKTADPAVTLSKHSTSSVRLVDKSNLEQATLVMGFSVPGELHPNRNAIALANYILGGGNFSSRLMQYVRANEGKTYGVSSQIASESNFGVFSIVTTTKWNQLGTVLESIKEVYRDFVRNGVTAEELQLAKQFAIGNMAFQLEGIVNVAEKLLWLRFYGRKNEYIENFNSIIDGISLEEVNNAISEHLPTTEHFVITVVGSKHQLLPQLQHLGDVKIVGYKIK